MTPNTILALQSLLISLQMINAGIAAATHNALVALIIAAAVGGFQNYVQHVGNNAPSKQERERINIQEAASGR